MEDITRPSIRLEDELHDEFVDKIEEHPHFSSQQHFYHTVTQAFVNGDLKIEEGNDNG